MTAITPKPPEFPTQINTVKSVQRGYLDISSNQSNGQETQYISAVNLSKAELTFSNDSYVYQDTGTQEVINSANVAGRFDNGSTLRFSHGAGGWVRQRIFWQVIEYV